MSFEENFYDINEQEGWEEERGQYIQEEEIFSVEEPFVNFKAGNYHFDNEGLRWCEIETCGIYGYWLCEDGRLFSERRNRCLTPHLINQECGRQGHYVYRMYDTIAKKNRQFYLHRLLGICFLENPNGYPIVAHINDGSFDNSLSNLRWSTYKQNTADAIRNGKFRTVPFVRLRVINVETDEYTFFPTLVSAANFFGLSCSGLEDIIRKHRVWHGYLFERI